MFDRTKKLSKKGYEKGQVLYEKSKDIVGKNLWLELLTLVALTFLASMCVYFIVSHFLYGIGIGRNDYNDYEASRSFIQEEMLEKVNDINRLSQEISQNAATISEDNQEIEQEIGIEQSEQEQIEVSEAPLSDSDIEEEIRRIVYTDLSQYGPLENSNTYLINSLGKIMYQESTVESFNLHRIIQRINDEDSYGVSNKFKAIYPVIINDEVCYLYNESTLKPEHKSIDSGFSHLLAFMAAVSFFTLIIFKVTRYKVSYIEYLSSCLGEISKGNLEYKIDVIGQDELAKVAESIMDMENKLKRQIEAQLKVEKSKNELVTNIAHDLRTPLTSIIGYIGLVRTSKCSEEERQNYLTIAYQKSEKLRVMIEDLFQLTKLNQGQSSLKKTEVSLGNLLNQLIEELMPLANDKNITMETYIDVHNTTMNVDVPKMTRVFENLIENAIKYTNPDETIYVELRSINNKIYIAVSNPSEPVSQEEINQFFERFYRADASRNSAGGSGLGLAIAKNIVELHGGVIKAEQIKDLLCFKVILSK